jgi:predicted AAA+ superfamily ATPase
LTESYLFYKVNYYNLKGKSILNSKIKYYATDLGILTILTTGDINFNYGYRLENAVLLKLLEEGYEVYTGKDRHDNEIDFVVKKDNTLKYIQVCKILNDENFERESRSLLNMKDGYEKIILTTEISVSETKGIRIIHIESYLLNEVKI